MDLAETPHVTPTPNFNLFPPTAPSLCKAGWWGTQCVSALRTRLREVGPGKGTSLRPRESSSSVLSPSVRKNVAPTPPCGLWCFQFLSLPLVSGNI